MLRTMSKDMETSEFIAVPPAKVLGTLNATEAKYAPKMLYAAGDLSLLASGPRVSVVGSRSASDEGLRRTRVLAGRLAEQGIVVVSGLAKGIDRVAHEAAIAAGGRTIAVIGTPLDESYPKANATLQALIARDHLVISQFPGGYPAQPKNFPVRNRTMALLSDATVIVEAGEKSGTVHQGWEALRLGRLLFLLESVANDPNLTWPSELIRHGAQVLTRENLQPAIENIPAFAASDSFALEA